ncbi:MAG: hypothetical protein FJY83_07435 [Candidatus Aminicenantes bacterium]|nr:hypothetical protein [Candidatus Aminicenantes bacterium]
MKVWKGALVFVLAVGLAGFFGCKGGGKYGDAKAVMNDTLKAMENFINGMDKAGDSQAVVKALNAFSADMKELKPKLKELEKKYPELKDQENPPEELKEQTKMMEEMSGKLMGAMMKLFQYAEDPEVQKAQEAMNKLMMEDN